MIFPNSPCITELNQLRGTHSSIADRFDLTLECIRQHYFGEHENPLARVLGVDADYFGLFGEGPTGFAAYVASSTCRNSSQATPSRGWTTSVATSGASEPRHYPSQRQPIDVTSTMSWSSSLPETSESDTGATQGIATNRATCRLAGRTGIRMEGAAVFELG